MRPTQAPRRGRMRGIGSLAFLALLGAMLGYLTPWPWHAGILVVAAAVVAGGVLQRWRPPVFSGFAPLPVVTGFTIVAVASPLGLLPELLGGASGLAILVWLADDPSRPAGGVLRAQNTLGIAAVALGIAWMSALLLPSNSAPIGVAAGLLVLIVAAVAFLFGQPELFDREEPSPS
jgi:hypothetical protein